MLLELTRVFLFDVCWILVLILSFRITFSSSATIKLIRVGVLLVLAEDAIRLATGIGISLADRQHFGAIDFIRVWSSAGGAVGALLICLALVRLLSASRKNMGDSAGNKSSLGASQ